MISATIVGDHELKLLGILPRKRTGVAPTGQEATLNMQKQFRTCVKSGRKEGVTGRHLCCLQCHASLQTDPYGEMLKK